MMFTDLTIRLANETLEQIDEAIEQFHTKVTDRQAFLELAADWALESLKEDAEGQDDAR
jgi:hypothetical protein